MADHLLNPDLSPLLDMEEVARILGVRRSKALDLVRSWDLPGIRVGRRVKVSHSALAEWIQRGGTVLRNPRPPQNPSGPRSRRPAKNQRDVNPEAREEAEP